MIDSISEEAGASVDLKRSARKFTVAMDMSRIDRLPPHSIEAEQGVLGCLLWNPKDCLPDCEARFSGVEWCYDLRHQTIYNALVAMANANDGIDLITLQQWLKDKSIPGRNMLDEIGGISYLSSLQDAVPSAANLSYYLDIAEEKLVLRKMIRTCTDVVSRAYENEGEVEPLIEAAEREILRIRIDKARKNDIRTIQKTLINKYQAAHERQAPAGIMTGFRDLDRKAGGMMGQEMIVIGATPSAGKTTLLQNIFYNIALAGIITSFSSLETSAEKLVHRYNCMAGKVDGGPFLRGEPTEKDIEKMTIGQRLILAQNDRLIIHDHGMTTGQWAAQCRKDYQRGARVFGLDMLQLLESDAETEQQKVINASKCVKAVAKELDSPVICISSLSRAGEEKGKKDKKPRKPVCSDLKHSSQIESDADKIYLLWCGDLTAAIRTVECNIAKNKDGELGLVEFTMFAGQFRMTDSSPVDDSDVPTRKQGELV